MATAIKCTAFFGSDDAWGWSETHHRIGPDPPIVLLPHLQNFKGIMETKRVPLLGKDRYLQGVRVSYRLPGGAIASSSFRYQPLMYPANQRVGCAPHLAAKVRMGELTNTKFSDIYLRGFWDAIEEDEELKLTVGAGVQWKEFLVQFIAALIDSEYGWEGTNEATTRRGVVSGYVSDVGGFVTLTVAVVSGPPLPAIGTLLPFRAARINNSNSALNRTHIVRVSSPTTVTTVEQTAALPFLSAGTFVITGRDFLFYTGDQYTVLARRAAGRAFFHSPGRLKARARG